MTIGPKSFLWVTPDTAGVPTGGRYGDVRRFVDRAKHVGLHVAWSRPMQCFVVYTKLGSKFVTQWICQSPLQEQAMPLTDKLFWTLMQMWEMAGKTSVKTIHTQYKQLRQKAAVDKANAMRKEHEERKSDVIDAYRLATGKRSPKVFSVPSNFFSLAGN